MEDLYKNDANCKNIPGFSKLFLAYDNEIVSAELSTPNSRTVVFAQGKNWGNVPGKKIQVSSTFTDGRYNLKISCLLYATSTDIEAVMSRMCKQKFVAKVLDRNGREWLAGMPDEPLNFEYEHVGDAEVSGQRVYKITLQRETTYPLCRL